VAATATEPYYLHGELYQGCWLVTGKQAIEDMRIFAAARREK